MSNIVIGLLWVGVALCLANGVCVRMFAFLFSASLSPSLYRWDSLAPFAFGPQADITRGSGFRTWGGKGGNVDSSVIPTVGRLSTLS